MIKKGTWVSIRSIILEAEERANALPQDTAKTPLIMWITGYLEEDGVIGSTVTIKTKMGRIEQGILEEEKPSHKVDYGDFVEELLIIGQEARNILFGGDTL